MIEVEAKIRVSNPSEMRREASKLGGFVGKEKKVDDYYTLEDLKRYPVKHLRVRKAEGYYVVNFKQSLGFKDGVHAKNEVEFKVSDINNFLILLKDFGFKKWVSKEKECETYEIKKNFHIELNNVKGLGWFIEVEYLARPEEIKKARKEVGNVLKLLGYGWKDCIKAGYTRQLWDKMHKN